MGKAELLIIHGVDTGSVITLYCIISKFHWVIRLVINSLHERVLTYALCVSNTAPHYCPLTNQPCVCIRTYFPLRRARLHFCDFPQRTAEPREARERNGWPASCLLLHSTSVDSDLGSGIEFAVSYQTGFLKYSPSHFRGSSVFSMCVFRIY